MRLKAYLLNEGRTKTLTPKAAYKIIQEKCSSALVAYQKGTKMWRGIYDTSFNTFGIVKPHKTTRVSANTENYYTLLTANSKHWKNFPRRDQSIICSTGRGTAFSFGDPYVVFPMDGARVGVCPTSDFWNGFAGSWGMSDLDSINTMISELLEEAGAKRDYAPISGYNGPAMTYKDLVTGLDAITKLISDDPAYRIASKERGKFYKEGDYQNWTLADRFSDVFGDYFELASSPSRMQDGVRNSFS